MTSLARLTNTAVNVIGSSASVVTTYAGSSIGVTGNNFDISSLSNGSTGGTVTIGSIGGGNVGIGNISSGITTISSLTTNIGTSGATTVNVGATGTTGGSVVNIGLGATGINIGTGSTGTVTIGNANGVVRLNGPLTLGSAPPAGSTASAPYLGSLINPGSTGGTIVNSTVTNVHSISLPPGTWLVFGNINYNSYAGTYAAASISTTSAALESICFSVMRYATTSTSTQNINVSRAVVATSNQTVYLVGQVDTGVATSSAYLYAVRVA